MIEISMSKRIGNLILMKNAWTAKTLEKIGFAYTARKSIVLDLFKVTC